jgi:FkbM family methyltransferase
VNEVFKHRIQRWFQQHGLRLESARHAKFSYEACNFAKISSINDAVILDVGANIGQTSIWFSQSFPDLKIYAFEPFQAIYDRLRSQFHNEQRVSCINCALGASDQKVRVARVTDPFFQGGQIAVTASSGEESEQITVRTVESFCREKEIRYVFILKTDTEGYDLEVLRGAEAMLRSGHVFNILTEASIMEDDRQHTNLFALINYLRPFSYELHGVYDLHHCYTDGRLEYFNVVFRLNKSDTSRSCFL